MKLAVDWPHGCLSCAENHPARPSHNQRLQLTVSTNDLDNQVHGRRHPGWPFSKLNKTNIRPILAATGGIMAANV